jgi:hypothetical protein
MKDFQQEKALVRRFHDDLSRANESNVGEILANYVSPDWLWRGMHPFNVQVGAQAVAETFWSPLLAAFTRLQRRPDIFIAGLNEIDGFKGRWVVQMGHLMGLFDRPWLGILPTSASRCSVLSSSITSSTGGSSRPRCSATSRI